MVSIILEKQIKSSNLVKTVYASLTCSYFGIIEVNFFLIIYLLVFFLRAAPVACGNSQARGRVRAVAADLHHSHSNTRSELHL